MKKIFEADWDYLKEVHRLFCQARNRYFELKRVETGTPTRNERYRKLYDACGTIMAADITAVYKDQVLDSAAKYYVYAHLDTTHRIAPNKHPITTFAAAEFGMQYFPFYVGKGMG